MIENLKTLSPSAFENLVYDLVVSLGLENTVWRTPGRDGGRDIEGSFAVHDLSGYLQTQKWYVECKRYNSAVDWPTVYEKIAYAESHQADFLLIATTSSLSPQAVDEVNRWNASRHLRVRFWNGYELARLLLLRPLITAKYALPAQGGKNLVTSLIPLSFLVMKFTNAAYGKAVFTQNETPALEAAAALSDLILVRLEQTNKSLPWGSETVRANDLYAWIESDNALAFRGFDRRALLAFFAVVRAIISTEKLKIKASASGISIDLTQPLTLGQTSDLQQISLAGDFEVSFQLDSVSIQRRTDHGT